MKCIDRSCLTNANEQRSKKRYLKKAENMALYREESLQICYLNDLHHSHIFSSLEYAHATPLFSNRANVLNHFYENICIYIGLQWLLGSYHVSMQSVYYCSLSNTVLLMTHPYKEQPQTFSLWDGYLIAQF